MFSDKKSMLNHSVRAFLIICIGALLFYAQTARPAVRYLELGKSVRGRTIYASLFGNGPKTVIVLGGIHGNEKSSAVLAKALAATLAREPVPPGLTVIIVSEVNPDALVDGTRVNASGIDINRNFPSTSWKSEYENLTHHPGKEPASEPETRAVINLLKRHPPDLLITIHAALGCMNWDGPGADTAALMASINGYPLCESLGYETPGSLGTLAGIDMRIPTVTIELRGVSAGELVSENLPALHAALARVSAAESPPK